MSNSIEGKVVAIMTGAGSMPGKTLSAEGAAFFNELRGQK
jgi:hypothetical protein